MASSKGRRKPDDRRAGHSPRSASEVAFQEAVALRAYDLFITRGATHGHDLDDWLEAERELRNSRTGVHQ